MAKTDPAAILAEELKQLASEDAARALRVRRIEALQLPVAAEVIDIIQTRSVADARDLLAQKLPSLTDGMAIVTKSLIEIIDNTQSVFLNETRRIRAQIEADAKSAAAD